MAFKHSDIRNPLLGAWIIALLLVAGTQAADTPAKAAAPADRSSIDVTVADMIKLVGEGRIDQMLDRLAPVLDSERDDYEKARERIMHVYGNSGKYAGFDIAGSKGLSPRYQVEYVLVYFEKRPVLFEFGFYQVDGKWRPQHLYVETDFKALLDTMPMQK